MTKEIKVRKKKNTKNSSTNISLLIESMTEEEFVKFDEEKIKLSIVEELELKEDSADIITKEVIKRLEKLLEGSTIKVLDTSIIRSFVNVVLYENGFNKELKSNKDIILSAHDITNIIEDANKENGNMEHSPESINFTIAERIIKEYSLKKVFTKEVEKAHLSNEIYVHDLGASAVRAYCSGHSIEYLKLNGLKNIPSILTTSKPANSAWTLARHLCSFTQVLAGLYAGAIGWEGINVFFAPMLKGWNRKKLKQLAQTLIFDISQLSGAKGGQTAFTDFNCYITIPDYYKETLVVGKSGKYMGKTILGKIKYFKNKKELLNNKEVTPLKYKDFEKESQNFLYAILDVIKEGDSRGLPFAFPKINLHINENTFTKRKVGKKVNWDKVIEDELKGISYKRLDNKKGIEILKYASLISSIKGCPYFIFDRDGASISACCFTGDQEVLIKSPKLGVKRISFSELENMNYKDHLQNFKIFHNGFWEKGKKVILNRDNKKLYKITTVNNKAVTVTENHKFSTIFGDKKIKDIKESDYLAFNTTGSSTYPEINIKLTYEIGILIGAYLGDGSCSVRSHIDLSLNKEKYYTLLKNLEKAILEIDRDSYLKLSNPYNNVYPLKIYSKEIVTFIKKWVKGNYCYEKSLNLDCLIQSKKFRKGIIDGYYLIDGGNSNRIYTTSEKLVKDMECLFTSLGINTIINISDRTDEAVIIRGKRFKRNFPLYCIRWYDIKRRSTYKDLYKFYNNTLYFKVKSIEEVDRNDKKVYCFEMKNKENPYFTLPEGLISHNCRLKNTITDTSVFKSPEKLRFVGVQNVSINLPNTAIKANRDWDKFYKDLEKRMEIAVKAHLQKKKQIEKIMSLENSPLKFYNAGLDRRPYVNLNEGSYLIGIVGLNECIYNMISLQLHESEEAYLKGLEIASFMNMKVKEFSKKTGLNIKLEETPAESSLPFEEKILYYEKEKLKYRSIGKFIESYFIKYRNDVIRKSLTEETLDVRNLDLIAPSFTKTGKIENKKITSLVRHGGKCIYNIKFKGNKEIKVTGDHSIFSLNENLEIIETKAKNLNKNSWIVSPKTLHNVLKNKEFIYYSNFISEKNKKNCLITKKDGTLKTFNENLSNKETIKIQFNKSKPIKNKLFLNYKLGWIFGAVLAEGCFNLEKSITVTNTDISYIKQLKEYSEEVFGEKTTSNIIKKSRKESNRKDIYILNLNLSIYKFFEDIGCCGLQNNRNIPEILFSNNNCLWGILIAYIDGDGNISVNPGLKKNYSIRIYTTSEKLKNDFILLCSCLSLNFSYILDEKSKRIENWSDSHTIRISGKESLEKIINNNNVLKLDKIRIEDKGGVDYIPYIANYLNNMFKEYTQKEWLSKHNFNKKLYSLGACVKRGRISISKAKRLLFVLKKDEHIFNKFFEKISLIDNILNCDLKFIQIKDINKEKEIPKYVYDISVEDNENFFAGTNGLFGVHNTSMRLANLDKNKYGDKAFIKYYDDTPFYTNSIHFAYDSDVDYVERLIKQSNFHSLVDAGSIIHLWTGEKSINPEAIFKLVKKTWYETACVQWVLSPEFVCCSNCNNTFIGTWDNCPKCESDNIMQYTRITGYYVPVNKFNPGKKAERLSRNYNTFEISN